MLQRPYLPGPGLGYLFGRPSQGAYDGHKANKNNKLSLDVKH